MRKELLEILRCPQSGLRLELEKTAPSTEDDSEILEGWLVSSDEKNRYPIVGGIPRFVGASNYADNFGMQWNRFSKTQLDSNSGHPISAERFWNATGWTESDIRDHWVLDVGCGSGRFAEVALNAGAKVIALDYSSAVDACYSNLKRNPNLHVIQGDVYHMPIAPNSLPYVYSLGVLQHTPDVAKAFASLPPLLRADGELCADFYWNRLRTLLNPKYILRPITKRLDRDRLFGWLENHIAKLLKVSQILGRIPIVGRGLQRFIPVVDYTGIYPLSQEQLEEWALLDTFDMLGPAYDKPQSAATIKAWFREHKLTGVEVFHWGHLVGRGKLRKEDLS